MATVTESTSVLQFLLMKVTKPRSKTKNAALGMTRVRAWIAMLVRLTLTLAGFGFLTWGMFTWHIIAGLITAGLSCFVLAWLTKSEPQADNGDGRGLREHTDVHGYTTYR